MYVQKSILRLIPVLRKCNNLPEPPLKAFYRNGTILTQHRKDVQTLSSPCEYFNIT